MTGSVRDDLEGSDRVFLEKLRLAAETILRLGEDGAIPSSLEAELWVFRDRVERVLLQLPGSAPSLTDDPSPELN